MSAFGDRPKYQPDPVEVYIEIGKDEEVPGAARIVIGNYDVRTCEEIPLLAEIRRAVSEVEEHAYDRTVTDYDNAMAALIAFDAELEEAKTAVRAAAARLAVVRRAL